MRRTILFLTMVGLAALGLASPALAAPGDLDTSFGDDGQVYTQVNTSSDWATDLVVQPDNKILAVGGAKDGTDYDFALTRHNPDGSLDTSFDSDGKLTTDFGAIDVANAVALQPDSKIVVAGYSGGRFGVARYNTDGSLDTSFDTDGKVTTAFVNGEARDLAIQPDGKIVVAGIEEGNGGNFVVVRYNADGPLDTSFDGDGKVTTDLFGSSYDQALALALGPDGKIVLAGDSYSGDTADFALARYNADGSLDTGFDSDGKLKTGFSVSGRASEDQAWSLASQPDGKTIIAGQASTTLATARYNQDGSLDSSFGTGGKGNTSTVLMSRPALVLDSDGKLVLSGGSGGFHLARLYGGDDRTATGPVTAFTATAGGNDVSLAWTNPADGDFAATRVVRSTSGYATGPLQQPKVYEGNATSYTDAGLAEGRYYYTAFARDTNGNSSVAAKASALIDFTPPQTNVLSGPSGQTNDATPTFTFGGSDSPSSGAALSYSYKVVASGVAPNTVAWSDYSASTSATLGGTTGLGQGPHTFYVRAKDQAGNEDGSPASRSFTVDTTVPAAPVITNPLNNSYDADGIIAFSGTAEASTVVQVFEGATPRGTPVDVSTGGAWSKTLSGVLDGSHTYTVKTTDRAGNTSAASATRTVRVDKNRPTGTVTINSGAPSTRSRAVTLALRATDPSPASGVLLMRFRNENNTTWSSWQAYATSKAWTLSSGAGTKTVYVQYQDRAGNASTLARDTIQYAP